MMSIKNRILRHSNQYEYYKNQTKNLNVKIEDLLIKTKENKIQHTLPRVERLKNPIGVYNINDKASISGKTVLLVDDIVTTGSTLSECCRILKKNGVKDIYCVTIAKAPNMEKVLEG